MSSNGSVQGTQIRLTGFPYRIQAMAGGRTLASSQHMFVELATAETSTLDFKRCQDFSVAVEKAMMTAAQSGRDATTWKPKGYLASAMKLAASEKFADVIFTPAAEIPMSSVSALFKHEMLSALVWGTELPEGVEFHLDFGGVSGTLVVRRDKEAPSGASLPSPGPTVLSGLANRLFGGFPHH